MTLFLTRSESTALRRCISMLQVSRSHSSSVWAR